MPVKIIKAVPTRGTGKPDFWKSAVVSRPEVSPIVQLHWTLNKVYTISGFASIIDDFYTVPSGYDLQIGGGYVSCSEPGIHNVRLVATPGMIGDFRFDVRGDLILTSLAGQVVSENSTMTIYIWNNNPNECEFSLTLSGILFKRRD